MTTFQICGASVAAVMIILIIKQSRTEFSPLVSLAVCVLVFSVAAGMLYTLFTWIMSLEFGEVFSPYLGAMTKALGVALVVQTCAEICRDSGESAIAGRLEMLGKAEILLLSLPLMKELLLLAGGAVMNG